MTAPRPGWYPDPSGRGGAFRWWDGQNWTDRTRSKLPPRHNRVVGLLIGFTLVISGGVVGWIGWRTYTDTRQAGQHTAASGVTATPQRTKRAGSSPSQPDGQLDETTRDATLANGRMRLPGEPYELVTQPLSVPGVFDAMFVANAPVHPSFDGSDTWAATVGLGHVPAQDWPRDDLPGFAHKALTGFSEQFFGYHPASVKTITSGPATVDGRVCARITAKVLYRVKKLTSDYVRLVIIGCPSQDGSVVAAISSVPDDAPHVLDILAAKSLATLSVR